MTHEEKALSYFKDKFHCSQSVLAAYKTISTVETELIR